MYNKLFTKILDSSIWLAPDPHRLVWITLIAAMDEDGNALFACADNLAARARVTVEQAESAVAAFESPDPKSGDPDNEGRRIERFPGGWKVLNAHKYRALITKQIAREQTRIRTERWRAKERAVTQGDASVTRSDAAVTKGDESVTPSEALSEAHVRTPPPAAVPPAPEASPTAPPAAKPDKPKRPSEGSRLPDDFTLTPARRGIAIMAKVNPETAFEAFRDHWLAAAGAKGRKADWDATWRTWCRREPEMSRNGGATHAPRKTLFEQYFPDDEDDANETQPTA